MFHHLIIKMSDTADACSQDNSHLVEVGVDRCDVGVADGFFSCHQCELRKQVMFAHVFPVEKIQRIIILDFGSEMGFVFSGIETSDFTHTVFTMD